MKFAFVTGAALSALALVLASFALGLAVGRHIERAQFERTDVVVS